MFDAARKLGEVRHYYRVIDECSPRCVGVLFDTSLCGLLLLFVELGGRFHGLGSYDVAPNFYPVAVGV